LWLQDPLLEGNDGEEVGACVGAKEEEVEAEDKESGSSSVFFPAHALALLLVTDLIRVIICVIHRIKFILLGE